MRTATAPAILDETDRKILALLQKDARMTNAAVAAEVGLTAPSVFERIRKLEQRGVITGYSAKVDPAALGKVMTAFIRITLGDYEKCESGEQALIDDPDILECYHVAGEDCFILKTKVANPAELEALLSRIRTNFSIQRSVTMISLRTVKEDATLSVDSPAGLTLVS